jgi:hypothetical protein
MSDLPNKFKGGPPPGGSTAQFENHCFKQMVSHVFEDKSVVTVNDIPTNNSTIIRHFPEF